MNRLRPLFLALGAALPLALSAQEMAPAPAPEAPAAETTPAAPVEAPAPISEAAAPAPEEPVAKAEAVPKPRRRFTLPEPSNPAVVQDYIGHRYFEEKIDSGGWGWVKLPTEDWKKARWVVLKETPGIAPAPYRALGRGRSGDQDYEYKMRGYFANYQAYDPHTDEMLDVFVLESCEPLGPEPAQALSILPGPSDRRGRPRSTFSSRRMGE